MSSFLYAQIAQQRKTAAAATAPDATLRTFTRTADGSDTGASANTPVTVNGYVEATAALVPTEVLTLHALILSATTKIIPGNTTDVPSNPAVAAALDATAADSSTITIISDTASLEIAFWVLAAISVALYLVPRLHAAWTTAKEKSTSWRAQMGAADWARAAIPPLAFTAWTMLQRATAFDAAFPQLTESQRTVFGLLLAAVVIGAASWLAYKPTPASKD